MKHCSEIYLTERIMRNKVVALVFAVAAVVVGLAGGVVCGEPRRILVDTDIDTDDFFALLYLLKLNRSEFHLEAVTINTNAWADAGHAVNQVYDILYMMGRDDVAVGVGGEGGIMEDGTILPDVGGYLPLIDQGMTTAGHCRYRHAIPTGPGGRLDTDSNYGIRKSFLPQGHRRYWPLRQPTAQQVMYEKIVGGPISVLLIGSVTNFAIFLMSNPHLKTQIEHVYIMGGGVRSNTGGNLFTIYNANPYAEFNIFGDPFAAYQVIHSGLPITLVPLDATNTIPIGESFFNAFQQRQTTYEAQYCFQSLRLARDTWPDDNSFYSNYFMWDSFTSGVATSILKKGNENKEGENDFAEMKYINITVVTSNKPYNISDGSNPLFDDDHLISSRTSEVSSKFNVKRGGVHSGHVQTGFQDPFCITSKDKCKDGYTPEATGSGGVRVLVATKAKPNSNSSSPLDREFFKSFLAVLNSPIGTGRFNLTTQFPYYKQLQYKPDLRNKKLGKPVIFDMDMSAGDFLALFYLLKLPLQEINLKAVIVSPTGWANAATIDVVYDLLHMMGRDDIPVGLGSVYAMNQTDPALSRIGDCKYLKAIPNGAGGFLDSDTLYGLARDLPRSSRRYTAENSVKYGAPRNTAHPELRQPLALEVWESVLNTLEPGSKITVLANGPLTNLAGVLKSNKIAISAIQDVYIVGGHISSCVEDTGNVLSMKSNRFSEMNMFLDPYAAKAVLSSDVNVTLIPLNVQNRVASFPQMLMQMASVKNKTPEAAFASSLLSTLYQLQRTHTRYTHMNIFLGEILGATILSSSQYSSLRPTFSVKPIKVVAEGDESTDGKTYIDKNGKYVRILENLDRRGVYEAFWNRLNNKKQTAMIGSFLEQTRMWSVPPSPTSSR